MPANCSAAKQLPQFSIINKYNSDYDNDYDNDYRMENDLWQAAINIPKGERKTDAGTGGAGILIMDR